MLDWPIALLVLVITLALGALINLGRFVAQIIKVQEYLESLCDEKLLDQDFLIELDRLGIYRGNWLNLEGKMGLGKASKKMMGQIIARLIKLQPYDKDLVAKSIASYFISQLGKKWLPYDRQGFVTNNTDDMMKYVLESLHRFDDRGVRNVFRLAIDEALAIFTEQLDKELANQAKIKAEKRCKDVTASAYQALARRPLPALKPVCLAFVHKVSQLAKLAPAKADSSH